MPTTILCEVCNDCDTELGLCLICRERFCIDCHKEGTDPVCPECGSKHFVAFAGDEPMYSFKLNENASWCPSCNRLTDTDMCPVCGWNRLKVKVQELIVDAVRDKPPAVDSI